MSTWEKYRDMIDLPYPGESKHTRMPVRDRAAQFAPFAALTGFGAVLKETERITEKRIELDEYEKEKLKTLSSLEDSIDASVSALESSLIRLRAIDDVTDSAFVIRDVILQKMAELRVACDEAETLTAKKYWPFPTYGDLLFGVR